MIIIFILLVLIAIPFYQFYNKATVLKHLVLGAAANLDQAVSKRERIIDQIGIIAANGSEKEKVLYENIASTRANSLSAPRLLFRTLSGSTILAALLAQYEIVATDRTLDPPNECRAESSYATQRDVPSSVSAETFLNSVFGFETFAYSGGR